MVLRAELFLVVMPLSEYEQEGIRTMDAVGNLFPIERGGGSVEDAFGDEGTGLKKARTLVPHYRDVAVRLAHSLG